MDEEIRKILKQHLIKWSNTMVQIVGLERVAEELMGRTKWGIKPEMTMMVSQDWRPNSEATPSPAPLTPPASCQTTSATNSVGSGGGGCGTGGSLWEGDCSSSGSSSPGAIPTWFIRPMESPPDQPLDLSAKSKQEPNSPGPSTLPPPPIKLPPLPRHIFKAKPRLSAVPGRRTYTEEELQAALRDIQSGKLGTRRAAVLYGIPRSTLRNKVYKLSQEKRDKEEEEEDEEEKEVLGVYRKPILTVEDVVRLAGGNSIPYLERIVKDGVPEAVRNMIAEERRLDASERRSDEPLRVPSLRTSPPTSPALHRPHASPSLNNNNNEDKKPSTSKSQPAGGKGTRPKRGKYRNYDRDSLVEAVRAVQRGEMSVHRAGSYYGVPHSTLEYKVKERHLMRPRKREPKLQNSLQEEIKRKEEADKRAATAQMAARRPPARFTAPTNGLKLGILDASLYPGWPPLTWPPHWPPGLEAYSRPELFPSPSTFLRLAEEHAAASTSSAGLSKATRRVAESLYDGTGENGSFLDGIIRSSLEEPPADSKPPILDHLIKGQPVSSPSPSPQPPTPSACDNNPS